MFITFEGIEGAGKGTLIAGLDSWLRGQGTDCLCTREPGGCSLGNTLRSLLLDARAVVSPRAELFLYLADRAQHVQEVIRPALDRGTWVLCDRYADSTIVYQGFGRGLDTEELFRLNAIAVQGLWPDLTILLDLPPEIGLARARERNIRQGLEVSEGRFEAERMEFHQRTREGYLAWARREPRFRVVDATLPPQAVFERARDMIEGERVLREKCPGLESRSNCR